MKGYIDIFPESPYSYDRKTPFATTQRGRSLVIVVVKMIEAVWERLLGGLWHTTSMERFQRIRHDGAILPKPDLPDSERCNTSRGCNYYPYARSLDAVSLFDFQDFDREAYERDYPVSSIATFVPFRQNWGHAVWIEINRAAVALNMIHPADLVVGWKADDAYRRNIMPYIEAAHLGPIPTSAFAGGFMVDQDSALTELNIEHDGQS